MSKRNAVVNDDDLDLDDDAPVDPDPDLLRPSSLAWRRRTAIEMVISGLIGLFASFVLAIEAWQLAGGKTKASCDFNSAISCTTVAQSEEAKLFGFPNAFLGIAAEAVVLTVALAILGGVVFPRWFMRIAQVIYTFGLVFAWWLFYVAYTDIKALCPWCLLITVTTTLVWAGLTRLNIRDRVIDLPGRAGPWGRRFVQSGNDWYVTIAVLLVLAGLVWLGYGYTLL